MNETIHQITLTCTKCLSWIQSLHIAFQTKISYATSVTLLIRIYVRPITAKHLNKSNYVYF